MMKMKKRNLIRGFVFISFAVLVLFPFPASAGDPTVQVKSSVERVIEILRDPSLQDEAKKGERRKLLREAIFRRFDFTEMAKRSLGAHWRRQTPEKQREFVRVFTDLLERAYLGRIESYNIEKFVYTNERLDDPYAEVDSKILTSEGEEFTLNYKIHRVGDDWKIYDLVVENISLVNNYRSQFNRVINKSSYDDLVSRIKQKLSDTASNRI
jgi:phospholipid transport system substrate-binding protein